MLNSKQAKIYREIWATPYSKKLRFNDVDKLLVSIGCERGKSGGASVSLKLNGHVWAMHPPHPSPYLKTPYIKKLRAFLMLIEKDNLLE